MFIPFPFHSVLNWALGEGKGRKEAHADSSAKKYSVGIVQVLCICTSKEETLTGLHWSSELLRDLMRTSFAQFLNRVTCPKKEHRLCECKEAGRGLRWRLPESAYDEGAPMH
jgi:hypothetical protein